MGLKKKITYKGKDYEYWRILPKSEGQMWYDGENYNPELDEIETPAVYGIGEDGLPELITPAVVNHFYATVFKIAVYESRQKRIDDPDSWLRKRNYMFYIKGDKTNISGNGNALYAHVKQKNAWFVDAEDVLEN